MKIEAVLQPVDRNLLRSELTADKYIGRTRKGGNQLFEITAQDSPNVMNEIGRLREISFRLGGGGTGKPIDIDEYDTDEQDPYRQLIVWDPDEQEIIGGYRYIVCNNLDVNKMATYELFDFSPLFKEEILPWTIELGRSFIQPNYQSTNIRRKSLFSLDNLWDGLGALVVKYDHIKYMFGKVTMYTSYNQRARDILLNFLNKYFPDTDRLVVAKKPLDCNTHDTSLQSIFQGLEYKEGYKVLVKEIKNCGEHIPPLINSYMNLSPSMKIFESSINEGFGGVEETGLLINISDIYPEKKDRHIKPLEMWADRFKMKWWKRGARRRSKKGGGEDGPAGSRYGIRIN